VAVLEPVPWAFRDEDADETAGLLWGELILVVAMGVVFQVWPA